MLELRKLWIDPKNADITGLLIVVMSLVIFMSQIVVLRIAITGKDSFSQAANIWYPESERNVAAKIIVRSVTCILTFLVAIESSRTLRYVYLQLLVVGDISIKLVERLKRKLKHRPNEALREYQRLYLANYIVYAPTAMLIATAMQVGSLLLILQCTATVVGIGLLSPRVYIRAPFIAGSALTFLAIAMPMAEITANVSRELIRDWNRAPCKLAGTQKLIRRIIKTLKPIGYPVAGYGLLGRELKTKVWNRVIDSTMDSILTFLSFTNA